MFAGSKHCGFSGTIKQKCVQILPVTRERIQPNWPLRHDLLHLNTHSRTLLNVHLLNVCLPAGVTS